MSDTDRPSLARGVAECKNEDCLYHECKIWQREHEQPNLISFLTHKVSGKGVKMEFIS